MKWLAGATVLSLGLVGEGLVVEIDLLLAILGVVGGIAGIMGIFVRLGGLINQVKHTQQSLDRVEEQVKTINGRLRRAEEHIAILQGRSEMTH